ncbi:hypothetical protein Q8A64_03765 [Oxalobacteraceae bacterium R-40]|uniref:Uncharacterized protein n=1 Tax=Keguizhuia sedimenti TaxID=3064264 RepID=A0ABU1BL02_9BURK|nr:hypothetical protein [Oxalobacteraceae bacterium R-40]
MAQKGLPADGQLRQRQLFALDEQCNHQEKHAGLARPQTGTLMTAQTAI